MESLDKLRNGDLSQIRKNDAGIWVANDILKQGSQYKSYGDIPGHGKGAYAKIPPDMRDQLESDEMKIQKMKLNL
jgi:hypothetical protein